MVFVTRAFILLFYSQGKLKALKDMKGVDKVSHNDVSVDLTRLADEQQYFRFLFDRLNTQSSLHLNYFLSLQKIPKQNAASPHSRNQHDY